MRFLLLFFVVAITACTSAKRSHEIQAVRVPVGPYLKMTCGELVSEQKLVLTELEAAGASVDKKYDSEKTTELVGWIIFWPALFMFDGNEAEASQLASKKGQLDAITEALTINKCGQ
tara:strand:+ start:141 stop:491 length:351 start_codon:yes stop_codon:yes gene_type:complete